MSYSYFNVQHVRTKPELWLCKPDRTAIHKIKDSFDENLIIKFSAINELSLSIPVLIERNNKIVQNPLVYKMKERYLIRMKKDNQIEYFVILKIKKQMDNDGFESISYQAYSLGIQLAGKLIRDYEETSKNLTYLANDMLAQTFWKLDYVDADFDLKYRSFEVSSANVLQCIFDLAEKFNCAVKFDTLQRKISFHHPKNIGKNKGLRLKEGNYLESFNLDIDPENMVTRLKVYGQDGLEFRRLSPTGSNYIEDFSFFMYPFECDNNYNVIKSSNGYMSDSLCIALTKYQNKLRLIQGQFDSLTSQATSKRDEIQQHEHELSMLTAKCNDLENQLDVINYTYSDEAPSRSDWQNVNGQLNAVESNIMSKKSLLDTLNIQLTSIENQIKQLRESVRIENNFSIKQIDEWNDYIIEKEHYNDSITNDKDLLEEAYDVFDDVRQPPINLSLSIDNFLTSIEPNFDEDKLSIGDILSLNSKDMNVNISAKITEISFNYESGDVSISVSNTKRVNDDFSDLISKLNLASNTSTTVNIDKWKWDEGREANNALSDYINSNLDASVQLIQSGLNDSTILNHRGLISIDMMNNDNLLMIQNGVMFISPDGGRTASVAINKNGVFAEKLFGKIILGNKLHIEDVDGVVTIQNALMTVYDLNDKHRVHLGRYPSPDNPSLYKYGLRIYDGSIDIRTSENANRGVQFDGNGIRAFNNNSVRTFSVNANTGQVEIIGDLTIKTSPSSNKGVVIDGDGIKGYNASGQVTFQINNNGNAWFGGRLESATGTLDNVGGTVNNLGGTFAGTLNGVDGVFTGNLSAVGGTFDGLVTGSLSADTVNAIRIKADQIDALVVTADMIQVNDLSAISANMGTITSGNINIDDDVFIGRELTIGRSYADTSPKRINFGNATGGYIQHQNDVLKLGAFDGVEIDVLKINARLDISGAQLIGFP